MKGKDIEVLEKLKDEIESGQIESGEGKKQYKEYIDKSVDMIDSLRASSQSSQK